MFLSDIAGDVISSLHWKDIVDSHYGISLLFFRTAFNAVIYLCFRVNKKKIYVPQYIRNALSCLVFC